MSAQATRNSSQDAINSIAKVLPTFFGGSADLSHSNMTFIKGEGLQDDAHRTERNIQFVHWLKRLFLFFEAFRWLAGRRR